MRITVNRTAFAEAAAWVSGAISKNPPSPVLAGMRIKTCEGQAFLTGFDYNTCHTARIECQADEDGEMLVSGRFPTQIVVAMKGDEVVLTFEGTTCTVTAGRATYRIQTMSVADYPTLPTFPLHVGTVEADMLAGVLGTVSHAVSSDPNLRALSAYNITGTAGLLTVIATDRFRMARATTNWADASATPFEANVPGTALSAAVPGLVGQVQVGAFEGLFGLADATHSVITRVLGDEDKFPRTDPIFSVKPLTEVEADVAPLLEALKRARLVADEHSTVNVGFTDGLITVTTDGKSSDGSEEVDCEPGFGEGEMVLTFDASRVSDALAASPSPRVRFGLTSAGKQVAVQPVGADSVSLVIMPRRAM